MELEKIGIVRPGIRTSGGHERARFLFENLIQEITDEETDTLSLKPQEPLSGFGEKLNHKIWETTVEKGKEKLAQQSSQENMKGGLLGLAGKVINKTINKGAEIVRSSDLFNRILLKNYLTRLAGSCCDSIVSSQYMAFPKNQDGTHLRGLYLPLDLAVHKPVGKIAQEYGDRFTVLAPTKLMTPNLISLGIKEGQIIETGFPFPEEMYTSINPRLEKQKQIHEGNSQHHALIMTGSLGPEKPQALQTAEELLKQGIEVTILCGDNREYYLDFREQLEEIKKHYPDARLHLVGGEEGTTREDDLQNWADLISNPELTLLLTRPNEMLFIGTSLGFQTLLFDPFQTHEEKAYKFFPNIENSNVNKIKHDEEGNLEIPEINTYQNYLSPDFWIKATPSEKLTKINNGQIIKALNL
ncbi:hypothetical protein GF362_03525 [Candidatus Dojkabacteria bacterium]|nr:hypothetical protein [Candidatus Dojkabacteria bacterium]